MSSSTKNALTTFDDQGDDNVFCLGFWVTFGLWRKALNYLYQWGINFANVEGCVFTCVFVCLLAGLAKLIDRFSQNSVESWYTGSRKH